MPSFLPVSNFAWALTVEGMPGLPTTEAHSPWSHYLDRGPLREAFADADSWFLGARAAHEP